MNALSFLAIDLGTQSLRISAIDSTGGRLWEWSAPVESFIKGDIFEQSSQQWAALLDEGLYKAGREGLRPDAIAVAAPLAGYVALSQDGQALTPAAMYPDKRSSSYLGQVEEIVAGHSGANPYGLRAYIPDPLPHYLRIRDQSPEVFARMRHLLDATGWINWYLTGCHTLNYYTALRLYDNAVRETLGVRDGVFGDLVGIGAIIGPLGADLCERYRLPPAPVVAATFDSKTAYIGSGIKDPGDALDLSGTVTSFGVLSATPLSDSKRRVYSVPFSSGAFLARGSTASSGGTLEWARKELFSDSFEVIDEEISKTQARIDSPIFLPYLAGERTPLWNPYARGAMLGLSLDASSRGMMARAVYEGLAYSLLHIIRSLKDQQVEVNRAIVAGGLARNDVLCQIKANVLGLPLTRFQDNELTTIGLCVIAGLALGAWPDRAAAARACSTSDRIFTPEMSEHEIHCVNFRRYLEFASALEPTFIPQGREGV